MQANNLQMKAKTFYTKISMVVFSVMLSLFAKAQDTKKVDVDISTGKDGGGNFFASPWVWVVGVAVFILLLVALMRGGGKKD